ncbi:MAG: hypothetical protein HYY93_04715 [Planctomycetes bacterium]|nr:hypothetical protein [Planctomycetota bacterium]
MRFLKLGLALVALFSIGGMVGCTHNPIGHDWHQHDTHMHHGPTVHGYDHCGVTDYGHGTASTHTHGTPMHKRCCDFPKPCNSCRACHSCGHTIVTTSTEYRGCGH